MYQCNDGKFAEVSIVKLPQDLSTDCVKCTLSNGDIVLQKVGHGDSSTVILHSKYGMKPVVADREGALISCIGGNVLYVRVDTQG